MLYRLRRALNVGRFNRLIAGVIQTTPIVLQPGPLSVVSMVANRDVPMYLVAIKSFYSRINQGKVVAIVDQDMPQALRDTLSHHVGGIEFVTLEDIPTSPCQRGGTWERLLHCLDRSETEYTIQLDADILTVGNDLDEVLACVRANRAFTMADGFVRTTLHEAAEIAKATPSNYIGITCERALDRYPHAERLHYIRGSSGFAGFAKGGYTRQAISEFHQIMESFVGATRWREWGSEQFGSNFAVANSPDPVVLPYPEYASFTERVLRSQVKLFHFIGRFRFVEGYFARRSREVIAELTPGASPAPLAKHVSAIEPDDNFPLLFARSLMPGSFGSYIRWRLSRRTQTITVQMRARPEFQSQPKLGPKFEMRASGAGNNDMGVAYEVFVHQFLMPPVWIPPERVKLIVDLGANVGMSCLWWLANYWRARVIAFEPHPNHSAQTRANISLNGYESRIELHEAAAGPHAETAQLSDEGATSALHSPADKSFQVKVVDLFETFAGQRIDILKIDIEGSEIRLLNDPRFDELDVGAIVMEWHTPDKAGQGGRDWCISRLESAGYRTQVSWDDGPFGIIWGYRDYGPPRSLT